MNHREQPRTPAQGLRHPSGSTFDPLSVGEPWESCSADPHLSSAPEPGTPGRAPHGDDLDLHIGWDRFEQLTLAVARNVLGLRGIRFRRYGVPGQTQHGIDLAGREPDGRYSVIQCKDYAEFTAADLQKAVTAFAAGRRPFDAYRFIVATSAPTQTTQVADKLAALQDEHADLELDLWGSEQINEHLRHLGDVVARFWTRETAVTFCTGAPLLGFPVPLPDRQEQAQRILVGPLKVNDVAPFLRQAEGQRVAAPEESARIYGDLAERLEGAGFRGHAVAMRSKQLAALVDAQLADEAAELAAPLAVTALHFGDRLEPRRLLKQLEELARDATVSMTRHVARTQLHAQLIGAAVRSVLHPTGDFISLERALNEGSSEAPAYQPLLVLLLGEQLLASDPDRLETLDSLFQNAIHRAGERQSDQVTEDTVIRLRLVRASYSTVERNQLNRSARRHEFTGRHAALINAREARLCALEGRPDEALECWRDAVYEAIHAGLSDEAADWLYAIRAVNAQYGPVTADIDDEHRLAQAIRATGSGHLLDRMRDPKQQALWARVADKPVEAVLSARRWLADTIITGSWADEMAALEFLGDLYRDGQEPALAAKFYERAGKAKKLKEMAAEGDVVLPVGAIDDSPWWTLYARATLIEAQADLIDDGLAGSLLGTLTTVAERGRAGELMDSPFHNLAHQAVRSACALAARGTPSQAMTLLDLLAPDVPRGPNQYHHSDDCHAAACLDMTRAHPAIALAALTRLFDLADGGAQKALELVVQDEVIEMLAERQPHAGLPAGKADHDLPEAGLRALRSRIGHLDDKGLYLADVARSLVDPEHRAVRERAAQACVRIRQRPAPTPGVASFGTRLVTDAYLVTSLDEDDRTLCLMKLLDIARDAREVAMSRRDALDGARNLVIDASAEVRQQVFRSAQSFVQGEQEDSYLDGEMTGRPHPLSSVKISMGSASLRGAALLLAFASATGPADQAWVCAQAISLLATEDTADLHAAATALSRLPQEIAAGVDASLMAAHSHVGVRQASAIMCMQNAEQYRDTAMRLAHDSNFRVRRVLAEAAVRAASRGCRPAEEILDLLSLDPRHSVRAAARRGTRS
ncbi:hypothetical protein ABZY31_14920 [Streptomyces sp. NPDC006529]|uniref:hypothetical protein n=1 Tax=Streptomyces sp. NPDC006529 TaxID=3157177 RepID=UPI0033A482F3